MLVRPLKNLVAFLRTYSVMAWFSGEIPYNPILIAVSCGISSGDLATEGISGDPTKKSLNRSELLYGPVA